MVLRKLDIHTKKNETEPLIYTIQKGQLKWIKDLNVTLEIIKLKEMQGESFLTLAMTLKVKAAKAKIYQ